MKTRSGNTAKEYPIHYAARYNKADIIKLLVKMKADVNQITGDRTGNTALHYAAAYGNLEAVTMLHSLGAEHSPNNTGVFPIHMATKFPKVLEFFIHTMNIDINLETHSRIILGFGTLTPLQYAVYKNDLESVKTLISLGVTHQNNTAGFYPIHIAAAEDYPLLLEYFCNDLKVNVNQLPSNESLNSPLHFAATHNALDSASFLISHGAENSANNLGRHPIHLAARYNHDKMIALLVKTAKADVNQINLKSLHTPLKEATYNNHEAVKELISLGATITENCFEYESMSLNIFYELYIKSCGRYANDLILENIVIMKLLNSYMDDLEEYRNIILCVLCYHQNQKLFLENIMKWWENNTLSLDDNKIFDLNSKDYMSMFTLRMRGSVEEYLMLAKEIKEYMASNNMDFFEIMYIYSACKQFNNFIRSKNDFNFCRLNLNATNHGLRFLTHPNLKTKPSKIFDATRPTYDEAFNKELASEASYQIRFFKRLNKKKVEQPIYITYGNKRIRLSPDLVNKIQSEARAEDGEYVAGMDLLTKNIFQKKIVATFSGDTRVKSSLC